MNLVIIGKDTDNIAMDVWKFNTNYTVINESPYLGDDGLIDFIKDKDVIISTTADQFEYVEINKFLEYMFTYKFIPIFIADDSDALEYKMYTAINELIEDSVLYLRNENNEEYNEFIEIVKDYLFKRKESNDKTVRTPRKRKSRTSKK
jgi:hypothetical protein